MKLILLPSLKVQWLYKIILGIEYMEDWSKWREREVEKLVEV